MHMNHEDVAACVDIEVLDFRDAGARQLRAMGAGSLRRR
jgi:hypothetical protein